MSEQERRSAGRPGEDDPAGAAQERFGLLPPPPASSTDAGETPAMFEPAVEVPVDPDAAAPIDPDPGSASRRKRTKRMPRAILVGTIIVAAVVAVIVAVVLGQGGFVASGTDQGPASTTDPTGQNAEPPTPPGAVPVSGTFDLGAVAPFDAGPRWEHAVAGGWELVREDDGVRELGNDAGCSFVTSAGPAEAADQGSDAAASRDVFDTLEASYDRAEGATDVVKHPLDPVWVIADGAGSVEFLAGRVTYLVASGEEWTTRFVTRTFTATGTTLYASLQCPSASLQDGAFVAQTLGHVEIATG